MKAYQIMEDVGLGVMEAPTVSTGTSYIFISKEEAQKKANELWIKNTTSKDRLSCWCPLHYHVKEIEIQ